MYESLGVSVVETLAGLTRDVLEIPNGEALFAGQHGGNAVALHIFQRSAENAVHFFSAMNQRNIVTVENLAGFHLFQQVFTSVLACSPRTSSLTVFSATVCPLSGSVAL